MDAKEKFLSGLAKVTIYKRAPARYHWDEPTYTSIRKQEKVDLENHFLYVQWSAGGISGGSCWDEGEQDNHYRTAGEPEPQFDDIDEVLTELCPDLSFLQYKKLMAKVVKQGIYTVNEYYGNSSDYGYKVVNLQELFDALVEMGLL
jgi:hypothetical protein